MTYKPQSMKVKDVIKLIERDGWFLVRTRAAIGSFITGRNPVP
jgi:predicted RNA binding protein YcfA (HicA-like mRNA interferase family)